MLDPLAVSKLVSALEDQLKEARQTIAQLQEKLAKYENHTCCCWDCQGTGIIGDHYAAYSCSTCNGTGRVPHRI